MTPVLVALGAAVGAPLRFWLGQTYGAHRGILAANVLGSFLLGLVVALSVGGNAYALIGTGFCGGFTTYSTFAVQTHRLGPRQGAAYAVVTIGVSLGACALGYLIGQA